MKLGRWAFAATLIVFGVIGLVRGHLTAPWLPAPEGMPSLVYPCAAILVVGGVGLFIRPRLAAGVLLAAFGVWILFLIREIVKEPKSFGAWDGVAEFLVPLVAAWLLFKPTAIAQRLYGLALVPFGLAHYIYPDETVALIPSYIPAPRVVAYLTGTAFLAAGLAIMTGIWARLAAVLSVVQIALFIVLVWLPLLHHLSEFQELELAVSIVLTTAGWVVADSYRTA